jgi:hypothetical protein
MHRFRRILCALTACVLIGACSSDAPPEKEPDSRAHTLAPLPSESADVLRAKLNAAGMQTEYAANFDGDRLQRIAEHRKQGDATVAAEYAFVGARLVEYRGPKVNAPEKLELQFDVQGALVSGRGPNVSDEEIAAIRDRAQLLRSHAVAQRATRGHGQR